MKLKSNLFNLSSIRGRILLVVSVFLLVLAVISGLLVVQNERTKNLLSDITSLRIPVPVTTADLLVGINRASVAQRAYLLTGEQNFKEEKSAIWEEQIYPAYNTLVSIKDRINSDKQREIITEAGKLLESYQSLQNEIDLFFESQLKGDIQAGTSFDSLAYLNFMNTLEKRQASQKKLEDMVANQAAPLNKNIQELIEPLSSTQEAALKEDISTVNAFISQANWGLAISFTLIAIILVAVLYKLLKDINKSVALPTDLLQKMAKGELMEDKVRSKDELDKILSASFKLSQNIKAASTFALEVGEGKFDSDFTPTSDSDQLGNALIQMRDKLSYVAEEDKKSSWTTTGYAELGNFLRKDDTSEEELYNIIISYLVRYTDANQGAIFIVNQDENDVKLEMSGCYAYGRRKYEQASFAPGQGLVGQVYLEQDPTLLKQVPSSFVKITSGLGQATPTCVYAFPLMSNDQCFGVIEIASFTMFEEYQMKFLVKAGEQIASSLSKVRMSAQTERLLQESQQQTEELRAQEEEVRQNMEELQATQEEMLRKDIEMSGQVRAINNSMATIEFTPDGVINTANDKFLQTMGYSIDEITGRHHRIFVDAEEVQSQEYQQFWKNLANGMEQTGEFRRMTKNKKEVWIRASYTPVLNDNGDVIKVIKFAQDITKEKERAINFEGQMEAIDFSLATIEFDLKGNILFANDNFLKSMGYSFDEVKGQHHSMFVDFNEVSRSDYEQFWKGLANDQPQSGEFKRIGKSGREVYIRASYTPIKDFDGRVIKIVKFAQDVTEEKVQSLDLKSQIEAISRSTSVVEFDTDGKILDANEIFIKAMGYSDLSEIKGRHHKIFVKEEDQNIDYQNFWKELKKGKHLKGQFTRKTKSGKDVLIEGSYNPLLNAKGQPYKVVKFAYVLKKQGSSLLKYSSN